MRGGLVAALLVLSLALTARAQTDVDKAKTFFTAGAQAYERGDFLGAIQAFERANELAPRPAILFSIAQAYRRQYYIDKKPENLKSAIASYRKYIEQAPDGNRRADAAQALAELGPIADRLGASEGGSAPVIKSTTRVSIGASAPSALIAMDGQAPAPAPFIHDVAPGEHSFVVTADGFVPKTEKIRVQEGDFVAREVQLKELPGKLTIKTDGGQVLVDGRIVGSAPFTGAIDVEPGTRQIAITRNGFDPIVREIEIGRGETKSVTIEQTPTGQRKLSRVLLGAGALAVIAGGVFLGVAYAAQTTAVSLRDKRAASGLTMDEAERYEGARTERNTWFGASLVAFGTGAAIGATGLLLYLFDQPALNLSAPKKEPKPEPKKAPVEIMLSPTGASVVGSF